MGTRTAEATWPAGPVHTGEAEVSLRAVGPRQVVLVIDGMESSFHDLDDPSHLEFEYMQHADAILAVTHGTGTPVRALHLGGAGCSLATAWDATRPGSAQLAIEWDAELARLVREWFPCHARPASGSATGTLAPPSTHSLPVAGTSWSGTRSSTPWCPTTCATPERRRRHAAPSPRAASTS